MADQSTGQDDGSWKSHPDSEGGEAPEGPRTPGTPKTPPNRNSELPEEDADAREATLRSELDGVRAINETVESLIKTLENTQSNMGTVSGTIGDASTLLNTWTRILSQTEHNQRLILDPEWRGATRDIADMEAEARLRREQAERLAWEEQRRRAEAEQHLQRRAQEESRRAAASSLGTRGMRGGVRGTRGMRGTGRGRVASSASSTAPPSSSPLGRGETAGAGESGEAAANRRGLQKGRGLLRYRPRGSR